MLYNCVDNGCNYSTNNKKNFERHNESNAHKRKFGLLKDKKPKKRKKQLICNCGKKFEHASGLSRHKKECTNNNINEVKEKLNEISKTLDKFMGLTLQPQIVNNTNNIKYNISIKTHVQKYYADAPKLISPNSYEKIKIENQKLIDTLLYCTKNKLLYKHLGDFIVAYYKKDDPSKQSIWTTDVSRLTYIIKESLAGKESIWNHDYKGTQTKNYIINPMLAHIRQYIDEHQDSLIEIGYKTMEDDPNEIDLNFYNERQCTFEGINIIRQEIDNGILADDIIKYIAPYLYFKMPLLEAK